MLLNAGQKRAFVEDGFLIVPDVVPASARDRALRMINNALGQNQPGRVANYVFSGHENCDPLQHAPEVLGMLTDSPAMSLAEELTEPGRLIAPSCCMVASRFPEGQPLPEPQKPDTPHLDGIPNRTNGLPAGKLFPFSVLVGVYLSDLTRPDSGNLVVWPGSHRTIESYATAHPEGWFDAEGYGPPPIGLPAIEIGEPVQVTLRAGDVVLAHYQLAHSVAQNLSPHIRYAIYYRLAHRDTRYDWSQFRDIWRCHPALGDLTH
ncbi:MAG TPA: phytanoyl-CoA dioxygenase family protein [Acidimicrobiales bacterium]|nr:phytanoyl-CoA dioxygenase family protein [Acidimicrobiales bacterium]